MKTIYFIVNPQARNGNCLKTWEAVEAKLQERDLTYHAFFTNKRGHAKELAKQLAKKHTQQPIVLIAVGGDGTLHEVINGAVGFRNVSVGFIPGGSGNDFSRGFAIPSKPVEALEYFLSNLNGAPKWIDYGEVLIGEDQEVFFINNMGVGFDALISFEVNQSRMKRIFNKMGMGRLIYVYYLLKKLFTYKCTDVQLTIDGKDFEFPHTWFVTVSNQPYYGGGMKIAPHASSRDGILDITVVHNLSRFKLLLVFISVFWGKHVAFKEVNSLRGKKIEIHSAEPIYAHGDGEYLGKTPLRVNVQSQALAAYVQGSSGADIEWKERKSIDIR